MARSPFTPAQRRDWQDRMRVRLPDDKDLRLARKMDLDTDNPREASDYDKTVAGYLGELRRGEPRALTWWLDHGARLTALARVSGCRPEDFRADLRAVEAHAQGPLDLLWWSGFEDLGPVALRDGFVLPPVFDAQGGRLQEAELKKLLLDKAEIKVDGPPGAGVSTLLRWLAVEAEQLGWRPVRWDGALPAGRALVLLADPDDGLEDAVRATGASLSDWLKARDLRLLRRAPDGLRLGPVNLPWLQALRQRLAARAERRLKLSGLDARLEGLVGLNPEEAGLRLRDLVEPAPGGAAGLLGVAARRRLEAHGVSAEGLARLERWLPGLYLRLLRTPEADLEALLDDTVAREVSRLIDELRLTGAERDLLSSALPRVSGAAAREALRAASLLEERRGKARLRLVGLVAQTVADRLRDDAVLLRRRLIQRDAAALQAVFAVAGGPVAIASALGALQAPGLRAALVEVPERWRSALPWTAPLLARWLVLLELDGRGAEMRGVLEKLIEHEGEDLLPRSPLIAAVRAHLQRGATSPLQGIAGPLPDLDELRRAWSEVATELGLSEAPPEAAQLRWLRAFHLSAPEDLREAAVWRDTPDDLLAPPAWRERLRADAGIAARLLERLGEEPAPRPRALWIEGVVVLARRAPAEAEALLRAWLDGARERFEQAISVLLPRCATWTGDADGPAPWHEVQTAWSRLGQELEVLPRLLDALPVPRVLRPVLLAAARAWRAVAAFDPVVFVEEPFHRTQTGLRELLAALPEDERTTWLRAPSGGPGLLSGALARAGVAADALIALHRDLVAGRATWPRVVQEPTPWTTPDPLDRRERAWLGLLLEVLPPERLPELDVDRATWERVARTRLDDGVGPPAPGVRRWRWSLHRDLSPEDLLWSLVSTPPYDELRWKLFAAASEQRAAASGPDAPAQEAARLPSTMGGFLAAMFGEGITAHLANPHARARLELDRPFLAEALAQATPSGALGLRTWAALARAALLAGVDDDALWRLLDLPLDPTDDGPAKRPTPAETFAVLARALAERDGPRLRAWMRARLPALGALLDRPELAERWRELPPRELRALLAAQPGDEVGAGLVPALLRRAPEDLASLLGDPRTRTATLQALSSDPALRPELAPSLARLGGPPALPALQAILRLQDPDPIALLAEASAGWPADVQRALWRQVAGVTPPPRRKKWDLVMLPEPRLRARAWERLAALEGVEGGGVGEQCSR